MKVLKVILLYLASAAVGAGIGFASFTFLKTSPNLNLSPLPSPVTSPIPVITPNPTATQSASPSATIHPLKKFIITASNYKFFPNEIKVQKDDKVQITLRDIAGLHNISFPDFGKFSTMIQQGKTTQIEFIADETGTFTFYCGVEDHQQRGMEGKLIVE